MVPVPVPLAAAVNIAVTLVFLFNVTEQVPVPEQAPDQPEKVDPDAGVAVSVTAVAELTASEQVDPQLIEPPETVPEPVPDFETESV